MKNLYDVSDKFDKVREEAILNSRIDGEEETDYVTEFLDSLDGDKLDKIKDIGLVYKDIVAFNDSIAKESKRLASIKKRHTSEIDKIKEYVKTILDDGEKIKSAEVIIGWNTSKGVELTVEPEALPEKYQKIKTEANKKLITESIKAGDEEIGEYAYLEERKNVTIK
jgi:hypothetical protein